MFLGIILRLVSVVETLISDNLQIRSKHQNRISQNAIVLQMIYSDEIVKLIKHYFNSRPYHVSASLNPTIILKVPDTVISIALVPATYIPQLYGGIETVPTTIDFEPVVNPITVLMEDGNSVILVTTSIFSSFTFC